MISQSTQKLIQKYRAWHQSLEPKKEVPRLHVDEVASRVAFFYEKIREIVDWKEEHLLRKAAIERVLKRRLLLQKDEEAEPLILELIRGGHFPNDKIEEAKVAEVQKLIDKYSFIFKNAPFRTGAQSVKLSDWLLGICACEVEEVLAPPLRERALIEYMFELMQERIELSEGVFVIKGISQEEKNTQIYIAIQRALFKLDSALISFNLFKKRYPQWFNLPKSQLEEITKNIYLIWKSIEKDLKHPLTEKFYQACERYDTPYLILGDIISQDPSRAEAKLKEATVLESSIREAYNKRAQKLGGRIKRAAIYVTLSIFLSKILVALAIEIPFDKYITGQFSYSTLGMNILIPPLLMFFLILSIKPPKKENLERVIMEVMKIAYVHERKDVYLIKPTKKRGKIMNAIINIFYLLTFLISFGIIILILQKLNFGILSQIIFIVFLCLISFAGVKIRERAKELDVMEEKGGFLNFIIDLFSIPVIRMGRWLSAQWAKYNIVVALLNSLVDMPFQVFVEFIEKWRSFLKEKKEEIH